jgi:carboxyl-terminal processing protease
MKAKRAIFLVASLALMLTLLAAGLFGQAVQKDSVYRYLSIFTEVLSIIRGNYVESVGNEALVGGAFTGVTDAIDEFSYYVPPAEMARYRSFSEDANNGLGVVVTRRLGYAYVIAPVAGSPAAEAGVEAGDFIEKVNGRSTHATPVWQIRDALQAKDGKPVTLTVLRGGLARREEITIAKKSFSPAEPTLAYHGEVAHLTVPYFGAGSAKALQRSIAEVGEKGTKKLIIDVRGNAGGTIEEAVSAADEFVSKGTITSLVGRRVEARKWDAKPGKSFDGTILVLTDRGTAGPAEVFAAAVSGSGSGRTVGLPTFGKANVQRLVLLPSGGALYMTIGHYTTPALKPIEAQGVRPDDQVDAAVLALLDEEEGKSDTEDPILRKALSLMASS